MYIYKITNLINNKKYIGSTNNPERRKKEHFNSAFQPNALSYNYPLQKAIRKYGKENFNFEVIENCNDNIAFERERYYIKFYNSLTNIGYGYNQTIETETALRDPQVISNNILRTAKPCAWVDEYNKIIMIFESQHDAGRKLFGTNDVSNIGLVCLGKKNSFNGYIFRYIDSNKNVIIPEITVRPLKTKICGISVFNDEDIIYFDSISEAAANLNIERSSIHKCIAGDKRYRQVKYRIWRKYIDNTIIQNNQNISEIVKEYQKRYVYYQGKYRTIAEIAKIKNLKPSTVAARIRRGWPINKALELEGE